MKEKKKNKKFILITYMNSMFNNCSNLEKLDLSNFETSSVEDMFYMFFGLRNLQTITFGPNFIHKPEATTIGMFYSCASQDRPSDSSWQGVSFD